MNNYLKVHIYCVLLFCLVSVTESVAQIAFTGTELLARPTDHSITLNVVSSSALDAYIHYGTSSGVYTNSTSIVSQVANEPIVIVIDGLSANTKYYYQLMYRISGGDSFSARSEHTFTTQRPIGSTFKFDVTSDSHVKVAGLGNAATWQSTLTNVANDNPDFLIDLGDTFAMDGVTTYALADANYLYQRSATALGLVSPSVPIFIATGNHENQEGWHISDNEAIWGTNAQKKYFPNPIPDASFYSGNTDTYSALIGDKLHEDYYAWTWGDALFMVIDPFWYTTTKPFVGNTGGGEPGPGSGDRWDWTIGDAQYNWLKQTLENSNASYKFLFMHHPTGGTDDYIRGGAAAGTYCEWGGYNATDTTKWGFDTRRPTWSKPIHQILIDNHVSAVFHGHDHEYAYEKRDGIVYQEVPAAGFSGTGFNQYATGVRWCIKALASPGHIRVTVTPSITTVDYVNTSGGGVAYSYTIEDPLPVEMISFTAVAQKTSAQLKWSTATEVNNYGFEIERRTIASSVWAKVGFIAGNGTSNVAHNYTYADNNLSAGRYVYRLKQIDNDGVYKYSASTEVMIAGLPKELKLYCNYPNPFNPSTKVQFTIPENGNVRLRVYNVIGREVATLFDGAAEAGNVYTANFDGSRMASGLYLSVLEYGNQRITHKMMMTK